MPAASPDINTSSLGGAPTSVALARNRSNSDVWVAWYSLGAVDPDEAGTFAQRVWPRPNGDLMKAPGSTNAAGKSTGPGQPVAFAERVGGGVWLAYLRGYPTSSTIRLWRVGSSTSKDIATGGATDGVGLVPGPGGRLWLFWRTFGDGRLHAARTNPSATRLGAVRNINPPGGTSTTVWNTTGEGSKGPLSLLVNAQTRGGKPSIYTRHVLPGLTLRLSPASLDKGSLSATVTDAGAPVSGARVLFRGASRTTNAAGKAVFQVGAAVNPGTYPVTATRSGFERATSKVRVR